MENAGDENAIAKCLIECCLKLIEGALEMLSRTAYANMAISGDSFCKSAWNGFIINLRHLVKFYFANSIASVIVMFGKFSILLIVLAIQGAISYFYYTSNADED